VSILNGRSCAYFRQKAQASFTKTVLAIHSSGICSPISLSLGSILLWNGPKIKLMATTNTYENL
jgi:hypothetical protein